MPKWLYSSISRRGSVAVSASTRRRMACSPPTPGLPSQLKMSRRAVPAATIWSYTRSGVSRASVRSRRRCRMISWPAAKQMRWVKPSTATVSPSRTSSAIASRIEATLFGMLAAIIPMRWPPPPSSRAIAETSTSPSLERRLTLRAARPRSPRSRISAATRAPSTDRRKSMIPSVISSPAPLAS